MEPGDIAAGEWPRPWRWTRADYYRLAEQEFLPEKGVELIDGEIVAHPRLSQSHVIALGLGRQALERAFGDGHLILQRCALNLGHSDPEADFYVVAGSIRDFKAYPTTALLVIEISDVTLRFDLGRKADLYARAGIADYWVVDLEARRLLVHRAPAPAGYTLRSEFGADDAVEPLARHGARIPVADFLP